MREILFRGKSKSGKWVEGSLMNGISKENGDRVVFIYDLDTIIRSSGFVGNYCGVEVIPETVGQWTGLYDKNKKKIFEGDIVNTHGHGCSVSRFPIVKYEGGGFYPLAIPGWECTPEPHEVEVVGNSHEYNEWYEVE